ncbi:hypothetical protein B0H14DRAFT_3427062 [Mycena olivaceomarginata]|nr:hypothetical protein B0H14DRAFT_3427062 [Mycena olivaceomarginata]
MFRISISYVADAILIAIPQLKPPPEPATSEAPAVPPTPAPGGWRTVHAPHVPQRKQFRVAAAPTPAPPPAPAAPEPELPAWAQWRPNLLLAPGTAAGPSASVVVPPPRSGPFGARTPPPK